MRQYLSLCQEVLANGVLKKNRTGTDTVGIIGAFRRYDLAGGLPVVTTKKLAWKSAVAEMLGFLRGYDNAADFRALGCSVWDANANENTQWLENPNRKGTDDLGRIYGVQAREWLLDAPRVGTSDNTVDQLRMVYEDLKAGRDNRREIVTHWNPGEMDQMSLPPCHLLYQFGIQGDRLCLSMYQRSCDVPLGIPFNIAGYAWLLSVMARITGFKPGVFNHYMHDVHIYVNQIPGITKQLERKPGPLPRLVIDADIQTLDDLETWVTPDNFDLLDYEPYPAIKFPFSV